MNISFALLNESDVCGLVGPMKRAFDDDAQRFAGKEKGGPSGYDDGSFLIDWGINNNESTSYKIIVDDNSVGAFIIWWDANGESIFGSIFVDPIFQNKGIGKKAWDFIEANFPTKSWKLETPTWAIRNHHFYEKSCGFKNNGVVGDQIVYKKKYE